MKHRQKKGQSTLEYVLLVTAVIVIIIGLVVHPNSPFRTTLNTALNSAITDMGNMSDRLIGTHTIQ